jgi:hypothetical protein
MYLLKKYPPPLLEKKQRKQIEKLKETAKTKNKNKRKT